MHERMLDDDWYRVAKLRPYLRSSVQVGRHRYRRRIWYVLHDPGSGAHIRIDRAGYELVSRLDGHRSVERVWKEMLAAHRDQAPSQSEVISALATLHESGLLNADALGNTTQLHRRAGQAARRKLLNRVNPLSFQLALIDPTRILDLLTPFGRAMFSRPGAAAWLMLMATGLVLALLNIDEIGARLARSWLEPGFLFTLWIVYPVLKVVHELAHGLAVRRFGADVREMGIRLLVLMPVPYVDASASTLFADKRRRMLVAAAGIAAELALAGIAMLVWTQVQDGLVRQVALATVLIGSVSTLVFNANPLLRFDGYYVLSDWLELPNLAARSSRYWTFLARRELLRIRGERSPVVDDGEAAWLLGYGLAAWIYRLFVFVAIAIFMAGFHPLAGIAVLALGLWKSVVSPLILSIRFIVSAPGLNGRRMQAIGFSGATAASLLACAVFVPVPATTVAEGVVWLPQDAVVRAQTDGFVERIVAHDGQFVEPGQVLVVMRNDTLRSDRVRADARLGALETERFVNFEHDASQLAQLNEQIAQTQAEIDRIDTQIAGLTIRAETAGRLVLPNASDRFGSFVDKGALIGHVLDTHDATVRVVLANDDAPLVRESTIDVRVRLAESVTVEHDAHLLAEIPGATTQLPSAALGSQGGGTVAVDPADPSGRSARDPVFVVDVVLPHTRVRRAGGRAWVRFDHGPRSVAELAMRASRKLLLRHFEG